MRYVKYNKRTRQIIQISEQELKPSNEFEAVTTTDITHNYIYIDPSGNVKEYTPQQIEAIKDNQLKVLKQKLKDQVKSKAEKTIKTILQGEGIYDLIFMFEIYMVYLQKHLQMTELEILNRLNDNTFITNQTDKIKEILTYVKKLYESIDKITDILNQQEKYIKQIEEATDSETLLKLHIYFNIE